jgi:hypothetical protein
MFHFSGNARINLTTDGAGQGGRYFAYHPGQSKTRFIFVEFDWDDDALFDDNSIDIVEPTK